MKRIATKKQILDVGGGTRFMKGMERFQDLFRSCEYKTLDVSTDYAPDIVGDIHAIPVSSESVGGVICRSVLEHVERPADAVREIYRILEPDGLAFVQVPSIYPYHARTGVGAYPDYWRFFEDTIALLFKDFSQVTIQRHGGWFQIMAFFCPGQRHIRFLLDPIATFLDRVFRTDKKTNTPFYSILAQK